VVHPSCGLQEEKIMMREEKAKAKAKHFIKGGKEIELEEFRPMDAQHN
jgi:hypothetical protein